MNIVKFKDIILTEENAPQLSLEQRIVFNDKFKGKYVYAINWISCVAIEDISESEYIHASQDISSLIADEIDFSLLEAYIDTEKTEVANSVISYLASNKYSPDSDITIEELKMFRKWLAVYLLRFDQDSEEKQQYKLFDDATTHMLQYYANDMYDDVVKYLNEFGSNIVQLNSSISSCGCNAIGTIGGVMTQKYVQQISTSKSNCGCDTNALAGNYSISSCDPIMIYRKNIYMKMVEVFSNIDFWKQFNMVFLEDFKKYIDGIIETNLSLVTSSFVSMFADCGCLTEADEEQQRNQAILKSLSKSLQYLIDGDDVGHRNFISNSLLQWSSLLYENMYWK